MSEYSPNSLRNLHNLGWDNQRKERVPSLQSMFVNTNIHLKSRFEKQKQSNIIFSPIEPKIKNSFKGISSIKFEPEQQPPPPPKQLTQVEKAQFENLDQVHHRPAWEQEQTHFQLRYKDVKDERTWKRDQYQFEKSHILDPADSEILTVYGPTRLPPTEAQLNHPRQLWWKKE